MADDAQLTDTVFAAGQNEGIDRSILPLPQMAYIQNARMRKSGRWGKRWGTSAITATNLGSGLGYPRCIGAGFAVVDDRCSMWDQAASAFIAPGATAPANPFSTYVTNPRIGGAVSGWLPEAAFFPVPPRSLQNQTSTPCSTAYGLGYLWTATQFKDPVNTTDTLIRVVATNPADQTLAFVQEIAPTNLGFGGVSYPKLIVCGSNVVLTYLDAPSAGVLKVNARKLTSLAGGFGADTNLDATAVTTYDASSYDTGNFLIAYTRSASNPAAILFNVASMSGVAGGSWTDPSFNPVTSITIVGSVAGIYIGYGVPASTATRVRVNTAAFGSLVGTATLSTTVSTKPLLCLLSGGGVRCMFNLTNTSGNANFQFRDVSSAAALVTAYAVTQYGARPISLPFAVGAQVYCWTTNFSVGSFGYATLIRLPALSEFGTTNGGTITCPVELSVQDYLVSVGQNITSPDSRGFPAVAQVGTSASYAVPVPTLYGVPDINVLFGFDFRVLQVKHYSDAATSRSLQAIPTDSINYVPMGTLTKVDDRGGVEAGFVYSPTLFGLTPSASGSGLTQSSDYYYTAIYKARGPNGRFEVSAPATPVKVTMGVGQRTVTLSVTTLDLTARAGVQIEIYRTLANGQTYYLVDTIDGNAAPAGIGSVGYVDSFTDLQAATHAALYIQVGQTLANAFPPASRFGCAGGQRLFLGGLMRPEVVQCSKLIFGDQSPSFADGDAFRIVLPAPCTGLAWMDGLTLFTAEGIYQALGEGPDDSGVGDLGPLNRLPFKLGCIDSRSVITVDDGTFFQSARGLYLLPRGAGAPLPAGDVVMDTLATYPVITGAVAFIKPTEETVRWTCVNAGGTAGAQIVYDLVHKCWSVDLIADSGSGSTFTAPKFGCGPWLGNEVAMFAGDLSVQSAPITSTNSLFADGANISPIAISMSVRTGDIRLFGNVAHGNLQRVGLLAELRSACTLYMSYVTDQGINTTSTATRVFTGIGDYVVGQVTYAQLEMGNVMLQNTTMARLQFGEQSTSEGLAFIGFALEHGESNGMRLSGIADRIT